MKSTSACCLVLTLALVTSARATTWTEPQPVPDPVRPGAKCLVSQPMSYGSYIYQWPSKYDQVFWPLTAEQGIWFCKESGFTAFIDDFELTNDERAALATALAMSYKPLEQPSLRDKLGLLQQSYAARKPDARKQIQLLRVLAYYYETELADVAGASAFRRQALRMIETALSSPLPDADRLEYLFVSSVYYREFGDLDRSKAKTQALQQALDANKDEKLKGFVEYLTELNSDIAKIVPGGPLIPEREQP